MTRNVSHFLVLSLFIASNVSVSGQWAEVDQTASLNYGEQRSLQECEDLNGSCADWASIGECDRNIAYMRGFCPRACNICDDGLETAMPSKKPTRNDSDPSCLDRNISCEDWASIGECNRNVAYMSDFCPRACDICAGGPTQKPTKRQPTRKPTRKPTKRPTRQPTKRPTRQPTKKNSPAAAAPPPPPPCIDSNTSCDDWASIGECGRNPTYMSDACPKACNQCGGSTPPALKPEPTRRPTKQPTRRPTVGWSVPSTPVSSYDTCRAIYIPSVSGETYNYYSSSCTYAGMVEQKLGNIDAISVNNFITYGPGTAFQSGLSLTYSANAPFGTFQQDVGLSPIVLLKDYCRCKAVLDGCDTEKVCTNRAAAPLENEDFDTHDINLGLIQDRLGIRKGGRIDTPTQARMLLDYARKLPHQNCLVLC